MNDRVLATQRLYEGWFDLLMLRMELAGKEVARPIIDHPCGSAVLLYDPARAVALTLTEPRGAVLYLEAPTLIEAIAGVRDAGEDAAGCARREAEEEAGVRPPALEAVGSVWMTPSTSTERVDLFLGAYGPEDRVGAGGGLAEEGEQVVLREMPLGELWAIVTGGAMADAKLLMLLQALRLRRPELF